ncbi:keratocan-like [Lineus longissimus]|uniref:keratocan-like n=1 Tax=Lineus longissimus TaxID=88925 RepID=UPI002B4EA213
MASSKMYLGFSLLVIVCFLSWFPVPSVSVDHCADGDKNCTDANLCPSKCKCEGPPDNITDCSNQGLEAIPEIAEMNSYTSIFYLNGNKLGTLWRHTLPMLKEYFVQNNKLTHIRDDAFLDMPNITMLNLSYNSLDEISERPLKYLSSLVTLDISHNNLSAVAIHNFNGEDLKALKTLDLSNNNISTIGREGFYKLNSLVQLNLCHNRLKTVDTGMLLGLSGLSSLYLDNNNINHIVNKAFQPLWSVTTLTLNNNDLTGLDRLTFFNMNKLESLNLGYNMLEKVPSESLREPTFLKKLILDGNQIEKIEKEDFPLNLSPLATLSLSDMTVLNLIHGNSFDDFEKLRSVNISRNPKLASLAHHLFYRSFHVIRTVDISRNALTEVDENILPWDLLFSLDVSGNKWRCDCNVLWMTHYRFHKDIKCSSPASVADKMYIDLAHSDFKCDQKKNASEDNRQGIRNGLAATALVVSVLLVGFLVYRFRSHFLCFKKPGTYNTLYNIYDPTRENSNNVVIKYRGDQERVDSKTTGVDMDNEMKAIL